MIPRKLIATLVLPAVAMLGFAGAQRPLEGPDADVPLLVPPGHVLQGGVVEGAWRTSVEPAGEMPMMGTAGTAKECDNDVLSTNGYSIQPVSSNVLWPVSWNRASEGGCHTEVHTGSMVFMEFQTSGDYIGELRAWGEGPAGDGTYVISCSPAGAGVGVPVGEWGTLVNGRDMSCRITLSGTQPHEWESWQAQVWNLHFYTGSTRVVLY